jgi:heat shock protein HslJ
MKPMHAPLCALVRLAATGVLLAACLQTALAAGLEGQDWQLTSYRTESGLADAAQAGTRAVLRFEGGRLSGSAGCNRLLGSYTSDGDALELAPNMASTMMACPPLLMAQEQAVIQALGQVTGYSITNDELILTDAAGETLLTFSELQATPLTGTTWRLTHFNNGKGGVSTTVPGTEFMLMLAEDGRLSGKACNNYRGGFVVSGEDFALEGPLAATKMRCPAPEGINAQESAYFAALERAARYHIHGDELVLTDADGAVQARFRAAELGE